MSLIMKSSTTTVFNSFSSSFYFFFFLFSTSSIFVSWSTLLLSSNHCVIVAAFSLNSEGEALLSLLNNKFSFEDSDSVKKLDWNNLSSSNISPCDWVGIGCNTQNTHVVSLNLSHYHISGQLGPQIGQLSYLQSLDLSSNRFYGSIPVELWNCSRLQHLDLSLNKHISLIKYAVELSGFSGQLGPHIGRLRYLKYLNLQYNTFNGSIPVELWNCSRLQHLDLSSNIYDVELSWFSGFTGQLGPHIGRLRYLKYLNLQYNSFNGSIPVELWNCSRLQHLDLSLNLFSKGFSGQLGPQIGCPRYLKSVDLSYNSFNGSILLVELWNCSRLHHLDLSWNGFSGELPTTVRNLQQLIYFSASGNYFIGRIPEALFEISGLEYVNLGLNIFNASIPFNIGNATNMKTLILGVKFREGSESISFTRRMMEFFRDNELHGSIPSSITNCTKLEVLDLSNNGGLSGEIPLGLWKIPTLVRLYVSKNNLSGELPVEMTTGLHHLTILDLSNNHFSGSIPEALGINITSLQLVDFSNNTFSGEIPPNLCFGKQLESMDLNRNRFHGNIPPSYSQGNCNSLQILALGRNKLTSSFPHFGKKSSLSLLDIRGNNIQGHIPSSICNLASSLLFLDLSENQMNDTLPHCRSDLNQLEILKLRNNDFSGIFPQNFTSDRLYSLDLNGNHFEGKIPTSLIHSPNLHYLDLGNNQFNDTFPSFLQNSSSLEILVLRSNKLYGPLPRFALLNKLKVLDISSNYFTGDLPLEFILRLDGMKHVDPDVNSKTINYIQISTTVIHKGNEMTLNHTLMTTFRAIDLSKNRFQGTIPESIGELVLLHMLNLSYNNFTGCIPSLMGNLNQLESLDLSHNNLYGEIPGQLTNLTFLGVLDLSSNNLTGHIPSAGQFKTFTNASFDGNPELCGDPLSRGCGGDDPDKINHQIPIQNKEGDSDSNNSWNFGWEPVAIGYGCGVVIGLVIQYFVFTKASMYRWFG